MNYLLMIVAIWMTVAFCVVAFIRGAQLNDPTTGRSIDSTDADGANAFALAHARSYLPE